MYKRNMKEDVELYIWEKKPFIIFRMPKLHVFLL